jgi:hypothetical protein
MKLSERGADEVYKDVLNCFLYDAADRILKSGKMPSTLLPKAMNTHDPDGLAPLHQGTTFNSKNARRNIAGHLVSNDRYFL